MLTVKSFVNNPYQENTYLLYTEDGSCAIIDPGMNNAAEQNIVVNFINEQQLKPEILLNTHCHIDHVLGNKFIFDQYGLKPRFHKGELTVLQYVPAYAPQQGIKYELSPEPDLFLPETGTIQLGDESLELLFAPGHSPAHLCFYNKANNILIGGDVLFYGSIGRTDLPGGDYNTLIANIKNKLFVLSDDVKVYPGHGGATSIGFEKKNNPFFN